LHFQQKVAPKPPITPKPITPGNPTAPKTPEVQPLKPLDPNAPVKNADNNLPGLRPESVPNAPKPRPAQPIDGCLKRAVCAGADPKKGIDVKYKRVQKQVEEDELDFETSHLVESGVFDEKNPGTWFSSKIRNTKATKEKFETDVWPDMEKNLKAEKWTAEELQKLPGNMQETLKAGDPKWSADEIRAIKKETLSPVHDNVLETYQSPDKKLLVVSQSWNAEFDLNRPDAIVTFDPYRSYKRPAVNKQDEVRWSDMVMDNWVTSAKMGGDINPNTLRTIARDNIATPKTIEIMETAFHGSVRNTINKGDTDFDLLSTTVHTKPVKFMMQDHPELNLEIKAYRISKVLNEDPNVQADYYMLIDLGPITPA
jgi:hypothetical protein